MKTKYKILPIGAALPIWNFHESTFCLYFHTYLLIYIYNYYHYYSNEEDPTLLPTESRSTSAEVGTTFEAPLTNEDESPGEQTKKKESASRTKNNVICK